MPPLSELSFRPVTIKEWSDFESLFGERGACGGCWCMWYRLSRKEFDAQKGEGNRMAMKAIVDSGAVPGILAYDGPRAIGWCSVARREDYPRLRRSRIMKAVDDIPVWSIVCMFVDREYRRTGVSKKLLQAAVEYVRGAGGDVVEGYPVEPARDDVPDLFVFHGLASAYLAAGFKEVARRSGNRPVMRYLL